MRARNGVDGTSRSHHLFGGLRLWLLVDGYEDEVEAAMARRRRVGVGAVTKPYVPVGAGVHRSTARTGRSETD